MPAAQRRSFGKLRRLPSGRFQASYLDPEGVRRNAPDTFETRGDGDAWLAGQRTDLARGTWTPQPEPVPEPAALTFGEYAAVWMENRDLRPRTRHLYRRHLDRFLLPRFAAVAIDAVRPTEVTAWHKTVSPGHPTQRAQAYSLLKTIYSTAVFDEVAPELTNPCRVRGAGNSKRVKKIRPATLDELATIVETVPPRYRLMVLLAAWCAMRFGELSELRRKDIDVKHGVVRIRRAVTHPDGLCVIGDPKSDAGSRDVAIPPHVLPALATHLLEYTGQGPNALLFPAAQDGCHMKQGSCYKPYNEARKAAGREDLRFHDLRHTGATLAAATGATLVDLMARLGHSTVGAAMRYQHASADADRLIAERLSRLAVPATVTPIRKATRRRAR